MHEIDTDVTKHLTRNNLKNQDVLIYKSIMGQWSGGWEPGMVIGAASSWYQTGTEEAECHG